GLSFNSDQSRISYRRDTPNSNLFVGGPVSSNVPVMFKLSGVYRAPFGFLVAGNFQDFKGKPEQMTYQITRTLIPQLTGTTLTIPLNVRGETNLPKVA